MAAVDAVGDLHTGGFQLDEAVAVHRNIAVLAQVLHSHTDTGFGVPHSHRNVDGPHRAFLLLQHQNFFEVIFCRLVNIHRCGLLSGFTEFIFFIIPRHGIFCKQMPAKNYGNTA